MIRFAWIQSRAQAVVAGVALIGVAVVLGVTGSHLAHLYDTTMANCKALSDCPAATNAFAKTDHTLGLWLDVLVVVVPAILGIFWGAPLVAREIEAGTLRLAWVQSVTRTRWLAVKVAVVGAAGMAVAGLLSLMVTWWSSPLDRVSMNAFGSFDERDIVAVGYAAFAFALGVTAGVLIQRTIPAMAVTLVAFIAARLTFIHWVRPHLISPVVRDLPLNPNSTGFGTFSSLLSSSGANTLQPTPPDIPYAWITSTQIVDNAGHSLTSKVLNTLCPHLGQGGQPSGQGASVGPAPVGVQNVLRQCVVKVGATYHEAVSYQPGNRYWTFQWYELAIFFGASLALTGLCLWWVRHRLS